VENPIDIYLGRFLKNVEAKHKSKSVLGKACSQQKLRNVDWITEDEATSVLKVIYLLQL